MIKTRRLSKFQIYGSTFDALSQSWWRSYTSPSRWEEPYAKKHYGMWRSNSPWIDSEKQCLGHLTNSILFMVFEVQRNPLRYHLPWKPPICILLLPNVCHDRAMFNVWIYHDYMNAALPWPICKVDCHVRDKAYVSFNLTSYTTLGKSNHWCNIAVTNYNLWLDATQNIIACSVHHRHRSRSIK